MITDLRSFESFVSHEIQICRARSAMLFGWMWAFNYLFATYTAQPEADQIMISAKQAQFLTSFAIKCVEKKLSTATKTRILAKWDLARSCLKSLIIYMKKFLHFDWLSAVQFFSKTVQKRGNSVQKEETNQAFWLVNDQRTLQMANQIFCFQIKRTPWMA